MKSRCFKANKLENAIKMSKQKFRDASKYFMKLKGWKMLLQKLYIESVIRHTNCTF